MQQFAIQDGDLAIGAGGFKMVSGAERVYQDLSLALVEPYGIDRFHPRWGSTLVNFIGTPQNEATNLRVQSEVQRVINNYALAQRNLLEEELDAGVSRRRTVEVIDDVKEVVVTSYLDRLYISISVVTASGTTVRLNSVVAS